MPYRKRTSSVKERITDALCTLIREDKTPYQRITIQDIVDKVEECRNSFYRNYNNNVFLDEDATYGKSWGMLDFLDENNVPLIVVSVECNHHDEKHRYGGRLSEYSPFDFSDPEYGDIKGRGHITMEWMTIGFLKRLWVNCHKQKHYRIKYC